MYTNGISQKGQHMHTHSPILVHKGTLEFIYTNGRINSHTLQSNTASWVPRATCSYQLVYQWERVSGISSSTVTYKLLLMHSCKELPIRSGYRFCPRCVNLLRNWRSVTNSLSDEGWLRLRSWLLAVHLYNCYLYFCLSPCHGGLVFGFFLWI